MKKLIPTLFIALMFHGFNGIAQCTKPTIAFGAIPINSCVNSSSANVNNYTLTGAPDQYRIDWTPAANSAGLVDVPLTALPGSLQITGIPSTAGIYTGIIWVKNSSTNCESDATVIVAFIDFKPTITVTSVPVTCSSNYTLNFSTGGSQVFTYRIDWNAAANSAGFADVSSTSIPASQINLSGAPLGSNVYTGTIYVANEGCESVGTQFNLTTVARPTISVTNVALDYGSCNPWYTINYSTTGSVSSYRIDWDVSANSAGLADVLLTTLPAGPIFKYGIPSAGGTFSGTIFVSDGACESAGTAFSITSVANPGIVTGSIPSICNFFADRSYLPYSSTSGSPYWYRIDWSNAANAAGLEDVPWLTLTPNQILIWGLSAAGTFNGTLYVKKSQGCESAGKPISVVVKPTPSLAVSSGGLICTGASTTLTATGSPATYTWSPSTGLSSTTGPTVTASPTITTNYYVTATGSEGCTNNMWSTLVSVENPPTLIPGTVNAICVGQYSFLPYSSATGYPNGYRIDWEAAANSAGLSDVSSWETLPASQITINTSLALPGTYLGNLYLQSTSYGCESIAIPISVRVSTKPIINFPVIANKTYGDPNFNLPLTSSLGATINYSSSNTGVAEVVGNTVTVKGVGSVTITASQQATATVCSATSVSRTFSIIKADQTVTFNNLPATICNGSISLSATASSGGTAFYFASSDPSKIYVTGSTAYGYYDGAYIQAYEPGNQNYNQAWSTSTYVTVGASYGSIQQSCSLSSCGYANLAVYGGTNWSWSDGTSGQYIRTYSSGSYTVTYLLNGCWVTASTYVDGCLGCESYRKASDVVAQELDVAIVDPLAGKFTMFPNPANKDVTIHLKEPIEVSGEVHVIDVLGNAVAHGTMNSGEVQTKINTETLIAGTYIIQINTGKKSIVKKLVVVH